LFKQNLFFHCKFLNSACIEAIFATRYERAKRASKNALVNPAKSRSQFFEQIDPETGEIQRFQPDFKNENFCCFFCYWCGIISGLPSFL